MKKYFFHSFSWPFSSREGRGGSSPRSTRDTSLSTAISGKSAGSTPRRDQTSSEMKSLHLILRRPLGRFPVGLASGPALQVFRGAFWTHGWTNKAGISPFGGEVVRHSGLWECRSCALCCEVSQRVLFAKIPFLPFALEIMFFQF